MTIFGRTAIAALGAFLAVGGIASAEQVWGTILHAGAAGKPSVQAGDTVLVSNGKQWAATTTNSAGFYSLTIGTSTTGYGLYIRYFTKDGRRKETQYRILPGRQDTYVLRDDS